MKMISPYDVIIGDYFKSIDVLSYKNLMDIEGHTLHRNRLNNLVLSVLTTHTNPHPFLLAKHTNSYL